VLFWVLAIVAVVVWGASLSLQLGWDLHIYKTALLSLQAGHDPYAEATAIRRAFHLHLAEHPNAPPPFSYIYSPITLPLLRVIGLLPFWLSGLLYWVTDIAGIVTMICVGMQFVEERERKLFALLAPAAIFFPGMLLNINIYSGNIAYIVYGLVFATAVVGWRRGQWIGFYLVVLVASCFKAPWLTLLAIPVYSARRQWLPAVATGFAGCALFALQPIVWPVLFRNYLEAVELQFTYNRDFSASPAGVLAEAMYNVMPYQITSAVFYGLYAAVVAIVLLALSRRYLAGQLTLKQWAPVLLTGTILLNPRVMEYDFVPITLPMALIAWRFFSRADSVMRQALWMCVFFALINILFGLSDGSVAAWKHRECFVLVGVFAVGAWDLLRQAETKADFPR
jgi:hypothetical protein